MSDNVKHDIIQVKMEITTPLGMSTYYFPDCNNLRFGVIPGSKGTKKYDWEVAFETRGPRRIDKETNVRIVTVYLKGDWSNKGTNWDRGIVRVETATQISLADNEYGMNVRTYQKGDVSRIDETGHW